MAGLQRITSLKKYHYGMEIDNAEIEMFSGVDENDEAFHFAQFKFKLALEASLEANGMPCTICVKDGKLVILTHEEAAEYNRKRFNLHMFGMFHSHFKNMKVDNKELEEDNRREHTRTLEVQSKVLQAVAKVHKDLKVEASKRKTPGLLKEIEATVE